MFVFCTQNGGLYRNGRALCFGYSGRDQGRNEPIMESHRALGPIPRGAWTISALREKTDTHGPYVLVLEPKPGTNTYGRSGFLVHGDNIRHDASLGCIIVPQHIRQLMWESGDRDLLVVSVPPALEVASAPVTPSNGDKNG